MPKSKKKEKRISNIPQVSKEQEEKVIIYKPNMTVLMLATALGKPLNQVMMKLIQNGIMASQSDIVDRDTVELIALDYNFEIKDEVITDAARFDEFKIVDDEANLVKRPPVVTIMGHVDHGKTTLLDTIRNSRVALGEAGGITQHIGAYQINHNGYDITFIDTPGHAAFTQMRARGASITDIVVLVVAADDGVMPQTEEAIEHAKAAKCPIIVAVNKIDKPQANPDRVKEELSRYNLIPEEWGGDTIYVNISALKGTGVKELLENIELVADIKNLQANPNRLAMGTVIEAGLDKNKGPYATLLVQNGTLKVGDALVCGETFAKVRTMEDDRHIRYQEAKPSQALMVTGLDSVCQAGDKFMVFASEQEAKAIAAERKIRAKEKETEGNKPRNINDLFNKIDNKNKELNIIIKADAQGSAEALRNSLLKIEVPDVTLNIIRCNVGTITEDDINLADGSQALIIGFNVRPMPNVKSTAQAKKVQIRLYSIIYDVTNDIEAALKGLLDPIYEDVVTGYLEVRELFKISKIGTIAGCYVTDGYVTNTATIRLLREGIVVYEGKLATLRRFKDDVKEVKNGYECGVRIDGYNDIKIGDVIEASTAKEVKQ